MAFVHFKCQADLEAALRRNKSMMGKKKVTVSRAVDKELSVPAKDAVVQEKFRRWELKVCSLG